MGCQSDLRVPGHATGRTDEKESLRIGKEVSSECISVEEAKTMASRINAVGYFESSANDWQNLDEFKGVLHWCAIKHSYEHTRKESEGGCRIV